MLPDDELIIMISLPLLSNLTIPVWLSIFILDFWLYSILVNGIKKSTKIYDFKYLTKTSFTRCFSIYKGWLLNYEITMPNSQKRLQNYRLILIDSEENGALTK